MLVTSYSRSTILILLVMLAGAVFDSVQARPNYLKYNTIVKRGGESVSVVSLSRLAHNDRFSREMRERKESPSPISIREQGHSTLSQNPKIHI